MRGTKAKRLRRAGLKSGPAPKEETALLLTACLQCGKTKVLSRDDRVCAQCHFSNGRKDGVEYFPQRNARIKSIMTKIIRRRNG